MKSIKFNLTDNTPVKFKIRKMFPDGMDIQWKYTDRFNISKFIDLYYSGYSVIKEISIIEQLEEVELIDRYKDKIEKEHIRLKNKKRTI